MSSEAGLEINHSIKWSTRWKQVLHNILLLLQIIIKQIFINKQAKTACTILSPKCQPCPFNWTDLHLDAKLTEARYDSLPEAGFGTRIVNSRQPEIF